MTKEKLRLETTPRVESMSPIGADLSRTSIEYAVEQYVQMFGRNPTLFIMNRLTNEVYTTIIPFLEPHVREIPVKVNQSFVDYAFCLASPSGLYFSHTEHV